MDLPIIGHLAEKDKEEPEYFLALEITNSRVKSAVWVVVSNQAEVITTGTVTYWQGREVEELVRAADDSLASLVQKLAEVSDKEPGKVVLGLPASWVGEDNKIKEEKVTFLKELTKRLELSLMGFVVTTEALVQYLKGQEGVPPSAILAELAEEEIEVTLVHLGKVLGRQQVARSIDLGADLEEGLTRFLPQAVLPSRIIIFDGHASLEEARQQLLDHQWVAKEGRLPFLHVPKVEILSEEETVKAVALSGGAEAAKAIGLAVVESEKGEDKVQEEESLGEEVEETGNEEDRSSDFGFVKMEDVRRVRPVSKETITEEEVDQPAMVENLEKKQSLSRWRQRRMAEIAVWANGLRGGLARLRFGKLWWGASGLVLLVGLVVLGWWIFSKAVVTLEVQSRTIQRRMVMALDPSAPMVDLTKNTIPVHKFSGQANGQKSIGTRGQKTVGTKAKGAVTIYNTTGGPLDLSAGTLLVSGSGLKFSLDQPIVVASASGTADNNVTPGQGAVHVTAADVGPEYNLAAGTVFNIPSFTGVQAVAKNADAFGGGDKRLVQAVDKGDLVKLSGQLTDELTPKARDDLMTKAAAGFQVVDGSLSFQTENGQFDKQTGDEATTVTLTESVLASALGISVGDKQSLMNAVARNALPQGYEVDEERSVVNFDGLVGGVGNKVGVNVKVVALPIFDKVKLVGEIRGANKLAADRVLVGVPGFIREGIEVSPSIFDFLPILPLRPGSISIKTVVR